jgi:hypothetical protein
LIVDDAPVARRLHRNAPVNADHARKIAALSCQWLNTLVNGQEFVVSIENGSQWHFGSFGTSARYWK